MCRSLAMIVSGDKKDRRLSNTTVDFKIKILNWKSHINKSFNMYSKTFICDPLYQAIENNEKKCKCKLALDNIKISHN